MNQRLKSYSLWVAVAALGLMVIQDAGLSITPDKYNAYVDIVLTILILLGIVNNPDKQKSKSKKPTDENTQV